MALRPKRRRGAAAVSGNRGAIITTGRAGGLHKPPWGLLPAEPIGSQLNFSCMECPAAIQIAVGFSYIPFPIFLSFPLLRFLLFPRFARIFFLGIAKAFWNHRHCRWFSFTTRKAGACRRLLFPWVRPVPVSGPRRPFRPFAAPGRRTAPPQPQGTAR